MLTSASMAESGLKRKGFRCLFCPAPAMARLSRDRLTCILLQSLTALLRRVFLSDRSKGAGEDKMRAPFY